MSKWQTEHILSNQWAIYMKDENTEYVNPEGDNLVFDTKKRAMEFITLLDIIEEAKSYNRVFTLEDAQDVLDTKPSWYHGTETVEEAVADYIDAFGG